jgi:tight adherence protein B
MSGLASPVLIIALLFGSAAAWSAALLVSRRKRRALERRVSLAAGAQTREQPGTDAAAPLSNASPLADSWMRRAFSVAAPRRWGMRASDATLIAVGAASAVAAWLLFRSTVHFSYWICVPVTCCCFVLGPRTLLTRQQRLTEQGFMLLFPDAVDMAVRMLRAGLPITAATRAVADEAPAPVNLVFKSVADQLDIGIPFEAALAAAGERVALPDFRFFAVAISLQRATGGNLAATLETLAEIVRKRRTVRLQARAATGEVRMSAFILSALPFFVTGALLLVSPRYLAPLVDDPRGNVIVGLALMGLLLAYLTMRRMLHSVTMA